MEPREISPAWANGILHSHTEDLITILIHLRSLDRVILGFLNFRLSEACDERMYDNEAGWILVDEVI